MNLPVFVLLVCLTTYGDTKQQDEVKSIIQQSSAKNLLHRVIREGDLSGTVNVSVSKVMNISTGHKSEKTLVPLTAHGTGELGSQAVSDSGPNNVTNPGNRNATASDHKKVGADPAPATSKGAGPAPAASKGPGPAPAASKGAGPAPNASEHQPNNQQGDKGNVKVQDPTIPDPNEEEEMNESQVLGDREDDDNEVATADEDESEDAGNKVGPNAIREKAIDQLSKEDSESSHFFAYLVTTAILVTVLYIAYHNKRKIIAYVLEGRRGKGGRRPNSGEYQRLDHKI